MPNRQIYGRVCGATVTQLLIILRQRPRITLFLFFCPFSYITLSSVIGLAKHAASLSIILFRKKSCTPMAPKFDSMQIQLHTCYSPRENTVFSGLESCVVSDGSRPPRFGLKRYLFSEIETKWADIPLIVCSFIGGLVDGLSYNYWGNFSNMQTGICGIYFYGQ